MFGCECFCWNDDYSELYPQEPEPFSLPSPLPNWPKGQGFGTGKIQLGELEVIKITNFEKIWSFNRLRGKSKGLSFYRPVEIPEDFHCLGHYCQSNEKPLRGYVLATRCSSIDTNSPAALKRPLNYTNIWSIDSDEDGSSYFWFPNAPEGYRAMGMVVTDRPEAPDQEEVYCVREDLTELCEPINLIGKLEPKNSKIPFRVWETQPLKRGREEVGVSVGTFFCDTLAEGSESDITISCLKNLDRALQGMPNLDQIHALIGHYGPTIFFHPDEPYLPSSVEWFFKNGALLFQNGKEKPERITHDGSNLPSGGCNDGEFWIDLPENEDLRTLLKHGNFDSAEMYVHVKPAVGGTFTDVAMWVFCPFNGPSTLKVGLMNVAMTRLGQHVGDWEHFTLRISNFNGELWGIYYSEHSGGGWVNSFGLEFMEHNRPIVYSSKHGHASFPHAGTFLQGSSKLGIGVRNDTAKSDFMLDSSTRYRVVAAEYLGEGAVEEPKWLQYMGEWGPTIVYDSRSELDKVINALPFYMRFSVENLIDLFPTEIYGEEGPTGPKEKNNWDGDERC